MIQQEPEQFDLGKLLMIIFPLLNVSFLIVSSVTIPSLPSSPILSFGVRIPLK
jgi:hypothetical protein